MNGAAAVLIGRGLLLGLVLSAPSVDGANHTALAQEPEGCRAVPAPAARDTEHEAAVIASTASLSTDSARAVRSRTLYLWIDSVRTIELQFAAELREPIRDTAALSALPRDALQGARTHLQYVLDKIVFDAEWGASELQKARLRFPGSTLLERYEADLASHQGEVGSALVAYERLLGKAPRNASTLCARGRVLERLGRFDDSRHSYIRALDIAPLSREIFERLLDVSIRTGDVASLLEQLDRLQQLYPKLTHLQEWQAQARARSPAERPTDSLRRR